MSKRRARAEVMADLYLLTAYIRDAAAASRFLKLMDELEKATMWEQDALMSLAA